MLARLLHWGPITALSIIAILFALSFLTILSWIPPDNLWGLIHFCVFMFWVINILRNYFKASFIGPGHLSFRWKPEDPEDEEFLQFCESCQGFKAPRVHHCKNCKRCVLKMDHHCPWINNCVGHYNHKSFTLFLLFVVIGCSHAALMKILCIVDHLVLLNGHILLQVQDDSYFQMTHVLLLCLIFGIGLSIGVSIAVAALLYFQVKSIFRNETGIESWIVEKAKSRHRCEGEEFIYPYDLGLFENIGQVFSWSHDYVGDGITWPIFEGCDQYTLTIEQLEQKDIKKENTVIYAVRKPYNGAWFPLAFGFMVCWDSPWTEETRMQVDIDDVIHATRIRSRRTTNVVKKRLPSLTNAEHRLSVHLKLFPEKPFYPEDQENSSLKIGNQQYSRRWVYGEKEKTEKRIALGESHRLKGWIPRCCLEELHEDGITLLKNGKEKTS